MFSMRHLLLSVPEEWETSEKGNFFESFVAEILRPLRFEVVAQIRVTGAEIDILAKGIDQPISVLVECKAHRDSIGAAVVRQLIGDVLIRDADQGWLFTTSDLSKDGKGLWEEIQKSPEKARKFTWYSPQKTIDVLVAQKSVVNPDLLAGALGGLELGDWSLVVTPARWSWLVEIIDDGIPAQYAVFDARSGVRLSGKDSYEVAKASQRYDALKPLAEPPPGTQRQLTSNRAPVARVISGDAWEDPRPARPSDFVGRDEVIGHLLEFVNRVQKGSTNTRSFAILAPSGWGKSSLALKLASLAESGKIERCSLTAVDSRSAAASSFVVEALRLTLRDALESTGSTDNALHVLSLREPLASPDIVRALQTLQMSGKVAVLLFDQFEELFSKEALFEVFNAVRDLCLDIDASQAPLVLGFAWKTDLSLPQQHPAYHLWHELSDRRRTFTVREFKKGEIERIISKAERAIGKKLSRPLRSRLAEQCQGLPWLLKKLLVHVLQRISTPESQYSLLERELDIEHLFKDDLGQLQDDHVRCLKFVAGRAPVPIAEVEESFARETTNLLIHKHLLVRSGMNYVVYWDIFRDYLVEEKVPQIPWARTFQRTPPIAIRALEVLSNSGAASAQALGALMELSEGSAFNLLGDLVSLQLVDADGTGSYRLAHHVGEFTASAIAGVAMSQLRRHVVARAIERLWQKGEVFSQESWLSFFRDHQSHAENFSDSSLRQYSGNLRSWLAFAGLIELRPDGVARADGRGSQFGVITYARKFGHFVGAAAPASLEELLLTLFRNPHMGRDSLEELGLRNAISDATMLGLVDSTSSKIALRQHWSTEDEVLLEAKNAVRGQLTIKLAMTSLASSSGDRLAAAQVLAESMDATWKPASAVRVFGGLLRYANWANGFPTPLRSRRKKAVDRSKK